MNLEPAVDVQNVKEVFVCEEYGNGKSKTIQNRKHSRPWTDLLQERMLLLLLE